MKKKLAIFLVSFLTVFSFVYANDINSEQDKRLIHIGQINVPRPHAIEVNEPVAMYTISTATVDFTFDANYYSEYTIHLVGEYVEMDYFVYTPVVYIPVATFGEIVDIYIESEDCGSYYGVLDKTAFTSME